jgi:hypothetical protein
MTIAPRYNAGGGVSVRYRVDIQNYWLRQVVPKYGTLIDLYHILLDPTTGYMNATYASTAAALAGGYATANDTTHPSNFGHRAITQEIVRVVTTGGSYPNVLRIVDGFSIGPPGSSVFNLLSNPWFQANTTGWALQTGGSTGTPNSVTRVTDTTGLIEIGSFLELDVGTTANRDIIYSTTLSSGFTAGDVLSFSAKMQVQDVSGDWQTKNYQAGGNSSGQFGAYGEVFVVNGTNAATIAQLGFQHIGTPVGGVYNFGPGLKTFTVPTGVTSLQFWLRGKAPANSNYKFRFGELGLFNLTQSGIATAPMGF